MHLWPTHELPSAGREAPVAPFPMLLMGVVPASSEEIADDYHVRFVASSQLQSANSKSRKVHVERACGSFTTVVIVGT